MSVDAERDGGRGMAQPARDREDVLAGLYEHAGVGVAQRVQPHMPQANAARRLAELAREAVRRARVASESSEHQRIIGRLAEAELHAELKLGNAVLLQAGDD